MIKLFIKLLNIIKLILHLKQSNNECTVICSIADLMHEGKHKKGLRSVSSGDPGHSVASCLHVMSVRRFGQYSAYSVWTWGDPNELFW